MRALSTILPGCEYEKDMQKANITTLHQSRTDTAMSTVVQDAGRSRPQVAPSATRATQSLKVPAEVHKKAYTDEDPYQTV